MKKTLLVLAVLALPVVAVITWALFQEEKDYRAFSTLLKDGYRRVTKRFV